MRVAAVKKAEHIHEDQCPWCGSTISREDFNRIQERVRREERAKLTKAEEALRVRLKKKYDAELKDEVKKRSAKLAAEKNAAAKQLAALKKTSAEAINKARKQERDKNRATYQKDKDDALLKKDAENLRERNKYKKKVRELQRQLDRKTADELGEGAELDLYEELRGEFPDDKIVRVEKGQPGADIVHDVVHKGESCARIIIESKNRAAWRDGYVAKLSEDKRLHKAQYAVLASTVFPAGQKELHVASDVIIVSPARAVTLVRVMRQFIVRLHALGLSEQRRKGKMQALYKYITSDVFLGRTEEAERLAESLLELDVQEKKQHDKVWKSRGGKLRKLQRLVNELDAEVADIVQGKG